MDDGAGHAKIVIARLEAAGKDAEAGMVEAAALPAALPTSIYDTFSRRRRYAILGMISGSTILIPFSNTIYLPALTQVAAGLGTTLQLVTASVSVYMITMGVAVLVWGPLADRYGRRKTFLASAALLLAACVACALAPNVEVLIAFRVLQGAAVAGFGPSGQSALADVFPPSVRGFVSGLAMMPLLLGPILGPIVGGGLTQALGWRSTFFFIVGLTAACGIVLVLFFPETHQYYRLKHIRARDPLAAAAIVEAPSIPTPVMRSPLAPLLAVLELRLLPQMLLSTVTFCVYFACVLVVPIALAEPPFELPPGLIGLAFLPSGVAGVIMSPIAGWAADLAARRVGVMSARLLPAVAMQTLLMPISLAGFGWALQRGSLAGSLTCLLLGGLSNNGSMPAVFSWVSILKQACAAAAAAGFNCILFTGVGVFTFITTPAVAALGAGCFFSILGGVQLLVGLVSAACLARLLRHEHAQLAGSAAATAAAAGSAASTSEAPTSAPTASVDSSHSRQEGSARLTGLALDANKGRADRSGSRILLLGSFLEAQRKKVGAGADSAGRGAGADQCRLSAAAGAQEV